MSHYLVTGGAGFIGSNLVETLLRQGNDVRALDNFASGKRENLEQVQRWSEEGGAVFELLEGDLRDASACRAATKGVDFVLHLAAIPSVQRTVEDPVHSNDVNVGGTLNLLQACREAGVRRMVFASSSAIYGDGDPLPKDETMSPDPISPYGLQKLTGESYCALFHRLYGLETLALRYFNVFGPRQDPSSEYSAVIPRFLSAARNGAQATVYGDGEQTRDFLFVQNVVQANLLACKADRSAAGRAFNIAGGERISLNGLLDAIGAEIGRPVDRQHLDARAGDIRHSVAAIALAGQALDFRPRILLPEGLRTTLEAY